MPLFLLFLAICQLSLLVVARVVVSHAAVNAARAAVVVLEDDPAEYGNVERGVLSDGIGSQKGRRMKDIRSAATEPLKILAPGADALTTPGKDVNSALTPLTLSQALSADIYNNFAALVTLHDTTTGDTYAREPVAMDATVTARVIYYYECDIPLVRSLVCKSVDTLKSEPSSPLKGMLSDALRSGSAINQSLDGRRFYKLIARATLPNQGAQYLHNGSDG